MTTRTLSIRMFGNLSLSYGASAAVVLESPRLQSLIAYLVLHTGVP